MKPLVIGGVLLVALGTFILLQGVNYSSQRSVMRVGDLQASVEQRRAIPAWVGAFAILSGLILTTSPYWKRRSA